MRLYVTRHGETGWNRTEKIHTYSDSPETYLTDNGREEARRKGAILIGEPIKAIYHSPFHRTRETARIISQSLGCEMVEDERLKDVSLAYWDGLTFDEIKQKWPIIYEARKKDLFRYRIPDLSPGKYPAPQSLEDISQNVFSFIDERLRDGKDELVVGHKDVNRIMLLRLLEGSDYRIAIEDIGKIDMPTSAIYRIIIEPGSKKVAHNDGNGWIDGLMLI